MRRLVCAFVARKSLKTGFLASGPNMLPRVFLDECGNYWILYVRFVFTNMYIYHDLHCFRTLYAGADPGFLERGCICKKVCGSHC